MYQENLAYSFIITFILLVILAVIIVWALILLLTWAYKWNYDSIFCTFLFHNEACRCVDILLLCFLFWCLYLDNKLYTFYLDKPIQLHEDICIQLVLPFSSHLYDLLSFSLTPFSNSSYIILWRDTFYYCVHRWELY